MWEKNSSYEKKEGGNPHPSWGSNYKNWRKLFSRNIKTGFNENIIKNNIKVIEFFNFSGKEYKNEVYLPSYPIEGGKKTTPLLNIEDFLDNFPNAAALCAQLSWKHFQADHCFNLNFHQDYNTFLNDMKFYLKVDVDRELIG
ncbi:hypothetical protein HC928_02530 [bacterium]|nr:hypothetical protein [bacterium]